MIGGSNGDYGCGSWNESCHPVEDALQEVRVENPAGSTHYLGKELDLHGFD